MTNLLIPHLLQYDTLTESETTRILQSFEVVSFDPNDYFLKEGELSQKVAFIETGLLMYYKSSEEGEELVCDFGMENDWATQYQSLISGAKSPMSIKAIEPTVARVISFTNLNQLYLTVPKLEQIVRQIIDKIFIQMMKRTGDFQFLKAEERYAKMSAETPALLQRVPQYYIASYLGIAPQSLSRIRKK